jgi:hypothetical protein
MRPPNQALINHGRRLTALSHTDTMEIVTIRNRLETAMPRHLASLALVACLLVLSACCGNAGSCNGSHHIFALPVDFASHVP